MRPGGWLLLLCAYLAVWQPLTFAAEVTATLGSFAMRGPAGAAEIFTHGVVAAVAFAAGWGLWTGNPSAPALAQIALAACAAATIQSLYWTWLPHNTMPGDRLPIAVVTAAHSAGWIVYLRRSRRLRELMTRG
jgi:hypothetical protein